MKSFKLLGLTLLAVFALGAFAAATASAEEGFLPSPGLGNVLGKISTLETEEANSNITCATLDESHIEFLSGEPDRHAEGTIHWLKCKAEKLFGAISLGHGSTSEEILVPILFLVCLDPKNAAGELVSEFGVLALVEGTAHLEVPAVGTLVEVLGAAIGAILTTGKTKLFVVDFEGAKGKQTVAVSCLNEGKEVKFSLLASKNHGTFKPASENVEAGLVQFPIEVELMDK